MTILIDEQKFISTGDGVYQNEESGKKYRAKIWCIDNGFSFPNKAESNDENSVILSRFSFLIWGDKIPDNILVDIKKLKYNSFQEKLTKIIDEDSLKLFNKRIDELLKGTAKVKGYKIIKKRRK